jgi:putative endonuclease
MVLLLFGHISGRVSSSANADDPVVTALAGGGMERACWVYVLASRLGGTLYIGVTNNLVRRAYEHRLGLAEGFTKKYGVHRLVYFESYCDVEQAIRREKQLKKWNRAWKVRLIEEKNPNWDDLCPKIATP